MVLAPHPDDESLATGCVLQNAACVGAAIRVVFITDGENNPWAQRATERRWRIGEGERLRWGARRRDESFAALAALGVDASSARFLGFGDQSLTEHLGDESGSALRRRLSDEIANLKPTVLFMPCVHDQHPDHSATSVLAHLALIGRRSPAPPPRTFQYAVHAANGTPPGAVCAVVPSEAERLAKRSAILCHTSQLTLRRKGLLRFADRPESFALGLEPSPRSVAGPLRLLDAEPGRWTFALRASARIALGGTRLLLISHADRGGAILPVPISPWPSSRALRRAGCGEALGQVRTSWERRELRVTVTAPHLRVDGRCFAKLDVTRQRRMGFFDLWPWMSFGQWPAQAPRLEHWPSTSAARDPAATRVEEYSPAPAR